MDNNPNVVLTGYLFNIWSDNVEFKSDPNQLFADWDASVAIASWFDSHGIVGHKYQITIQEVK